MGKYQITIERISQETVEIEADSELDAVDLVISGGGLLVDEVDWTPAVIHSMELELDEDDRPNDSTKLDSGDVRRNKESLTGKEQEVWE